MKIGNLVKWRKSIGIVGATRSTIPNPYRSANKSSFIYWFAGDSCWMDDVALEVVSENK